MKKSVYAASLVVFLALTALLPQTQAQSQCAKIKDGGITDTAGNPITLGFDQFGYNYQAHLFNGTYDSSDRALDGLYWGTNPDGIADDNLIMKWSDDWISNQDCYAPFGKLDRSSDGTSRGWLTNQVEGDYIGADSDSHHYTYFAKIVYVGAAVGSDPWGGDVSTGGSRIWGVYAVIEEVYNDPDGGFHGVDRTKLAKPAGFGFYTN